MSSDTWRFLPQLIIAATTAIFAWGMFTHSRTTRHRSWPLCWDAVVAVYLGSLAFSFGMHALYWMGIFSIHLDDWEMILPLWVAAIGSTYAMYRWVRPGDDASCE